MAFGFGNIWYRAPNATILEGPGRVQHQALWALALGRPACRGHAGYQPATTKTTSFVGSAYPSKVLSSETTNMMVMVANGGPYPPNERQAAKTRRREGRSTSSAPGGLPRGLGFNI